MKKIGEITKDLKVIPQKKQLGRLQTDLSITRRELSNKSKLVLKSFPEVERFAQEFNLDSCDERYISIKTNLDGLESKTINIRELSDCYGDENISNWIAAWLISVSAYMNFEISTQQARITSLLILEELYMINIAELTLFFKQLRKGRYGIFYGKFNGQTILVASKEFRMERGRVLAKLPSEQQRCLILSK